MQLDKLEKEVRVALDLSPDSKDDKSLDWRKQMEQDI